ncbi:hypothetical protein AMTR_s00204p00019460 [Amborella trichopoda]|uniref:Uncharacterized protein n=1 Tax=Amborella trichopoda TaxID=13333 RepID=W1P8S7_AMBTC|nr:hypothetical protein AMTR_s00204p00019460 [Amborella trichopoda]
MRCIETALSVPHVESGALAIEVASSLPYLMSNPTCQVPWRSPPLGGQGRIWRCAALKLLHPYLMPNPECIVFSTCRTIY